MAQLDLPTLQVKRYVDLLKRRRWQLIPFAITGLLVGGIVAALIPRYYEAKTEVRLFKSVLTEDYRGDDMLLQEVETASATIKSPGFLEGVVQDLGWPEFYPPGPESWDALSETADRITVRDLNPIRGRSSARLQIVYRDRVAVRAKELTDKLLEVYLQKELESLRSRAKAQTARVFADLSQATKDLNALRLELANFDYSKRIIAVRTPTGDKDSLTLKAESLRDLQEKIKACRGREKYLEAQIRDLDSTLAVTSRTKPSIDPSSVLWQAYLSLSLQVDAAKEKLKILDPTHPDRAAAEGLLAATMLALEKVKALAREQVPEVDNPEYQDLKKKRGVHATELAGVKAELAEYVAQEVPLVKEVDDIPSIKKDRSEIESKRDTAERQVKKLQEDHDKKSSEMSALIGGQESNYSKPTPAYLPRTPTYPNIWIVASAGCLIGLFAAVGLVFLLDFVRSTFKTVEDAVRGLAVPVLGFVSHMETVEVQTALRRRRLGWTAAAAALVFLAGSIVVLYNVDKTRLPLFVHRVLDSVLGSRK